MHCHESFEFTICRFTRWSYLVVLVALLAHLTKAVNLVRFLFLNWHIYQKYFYFGYKLFFLNLQGFRQRKLNVPDGYYYRKYLQVPEEFDFLPCITNDTKAIIWHISFIKKFFLSGHKINIFLEVSVQHANGKF